MTDQPTIPAYDGGTTLRSCLWPGCANRFDIAAVMAGEQPARGWVTLRSVVGHLCGSHAVGGHLPRRRDRRAACECGWASASDAGTLGEIGEQWRSHIAVAP